MKKIDEYMDKEITALIKKARFVERKQAEKEFLEMLEIDTFAYDTDVDDFIKKLKQKITGEEK